MILYRVLSGKSNGVDDVREQEEEGKQIIDKKSK
jgi:hypothetical protein